MTAVVLVTLIEATELMDKLDVDPGVEKVKFAEVVLVPFEETTA